MSFLKNLGSSQKKTTREGQPAKRRGPKPDSKPAQTRRQELNRQAQRTHRERKEQYIRALETEVSRLREGYSNDMSSASISIQQHRDALQEQKEENMILREILTSHGIPFDAELEQRKSAARAGIYGSSLAGSTSNSQSLGAPGSGNFMGMTTPPTTISAVMSPGTIGSDFADANQSAGGFSYPGNQASQAEQPAILDQSGGWSGGGSAVADIPGIFEKEPQLGVDFILTLEKSCLTHMEFLCRRASDDEEGETISGHVLMASCPPPTQITATDPGQMYPSQTYHLPHANLNTLLNLSRQLVTEGQITPIMALQYLKNHDMYHTLTRDDVIRMMDDLTAKIRCYGFGAVLEDFEFRDSFSSVLASKIEDSPVQVKDIQGNGYSRRIDDMLYS